VKNICILCSPFPFPPSRGGSAVRAFNVIKYLGRYHKVTLVTQRNESVQDEEVVELRKWVSRLVLFPNCDGSKLEGVRRSCYYARNLGKAIARGTHPFNMRYYSSAMEAWVRANTKTFDVVICDDIQDEIYIGAEDSNSVKRVIDVYSSVYLWTRSHVESGAYKSRGFASSIKTVGHKLSLPWLHRYEKNYCNKFNKVIVTTEDDRAYFARFVPAANLYVIPNGVDLELYPYRKENVGGHNLVFVGTMDATHNIDAVGFFASRVFPLVRERYPDASFRIVGARPTAAVMELQKEPGVTVTGEVVRVSDELWRATACVVPLRAGNGIKNKTLEAMASGVPVVGSDRALEGLVVDGEGVPLRALRANRIEEYLGAVSHMFEDADFRDDISRKARSYIESNYTWSTVGESYGRALMAPEWKTVKNCDSEARGCA
jgi:polysaccharide biosynthesis protein PslH